MFFITILGVCIATIAIVAVYFWLPIPGLSVDQGPQTIEGEVEKITNLPGNIIEVLLRQKLEISPELKEGSACMTSASIGQYIHFRKNSPLVPAVGSLVTAFTINRNHFFRGRSLNWAYALHIQDSVPIGGKVIAV